MSANPNQFMQTFIAEAHELLQGMEEILLHLENGPHDADIIDALFRTAHTIKGSAGMFNLEPIVNFTHIVEDVLDHMRDGEIEIEGDMIAVLLESCDHILQLVNVVAEQGEQMDDAAQARESGLRKRLQVYQEDARAKNDGSKDEDKQETRITLAAEEGHSIDLQRRRRSQLRQLAYFPALRAERLERRGWIRFT